MNFQGNGEPPHNRAVWMELLSQSQPATVARLAHAVEDLTPVEVTRPPAQSLVLLTLEDSVEGNPFHPGEILVSTCEVRLAGQLGFGICLGGDLERARSCAILDAALQAALPHTPEILRVLGAEQARLQQLRHAEQEMAQATRVHFDTMDSQR